MGGFDLTVRLNTPDERCENHDDGSEDHPAWELATQLGNVAKAYKLMGLSSTVPR